METSNSPDPGNDRDRFIPDNNSVGAPDAVVFNPDDEFSIEQAVTLKPKAEQRTWTALMTGVQQHFEDFKTAVIEGTIDAKKRYTEAKKSLIESTDRSLETVADTYVEKYEAARDPKTGEVPSSYFARISRAVDTVKSSVNLATAVELGCRAALRPLEFSVSMAARYTFADFAVKAVEYAELEKTYNAQGGVKKIEKQAMDFAQQVRQHFESLGAMADKELPGEKPEDREAFRQQKITEGVAQAEGLLQGTHIAPEAQKKILADLRVYLDTTVYDPSRPSMLRKWDKLGRGYQPAITALVTKHIDVYQKRQERNRSLFRSLASVSGFGLESYAVSRVMSAEAALTSNYEKELTKLTSEQRTAVERGRAFGHALKEGMIQLLMTDAFRQTRAESSRIDEMIADLIPDESASIGNPEFDALGDKMFEKFRPQLEAKGLTREWVDQQLDIALLQKVGKRRTELSSILQTRLYDMHRRQVKSAVKQAEHLYDQYNVNITALSIMGNADMAINEYTRVRDGIGVILEHASGGHIDPSIATADQDAFSKLPTEPQVALATFGAETIYQAVEAAIGDTKAETASIEHPLETPAENVEFSDLQEVPEENQVDFGPSESPDESTIDESLPDEPIDVASPESTVPTTLMGEHVIEKGDTLWSLAQEHLSEYQLRTGNFELTVPQAIAIMRADNNMGTSSNLVVGEPLTISVANNEYAGESARDPYEIGVEDAQHIIDTAQTVDGRNYPDNYVQSVDRSNLDALPEGAYYATFGERMGKSSGAMPVYYDRLALILVDEAGHAEVKNPRNMAAPGVELDDYLDLHKEPIVRVFQIEGEPVTIERETLDMSGWSQRSIAMVRHMQEHPESNVKPGEFCSKFAAGQLDFFAEGLSEDLGVSLANGKGESTGVVVHAPMWEAGLESAGGGAVVNMSEYFDHDKAGTPPIVRLETGDQEYRETVDEYIQAARVPLREATVQYDHTKIRHFIEKNEDLGGRENSHVIDLYGDKDLVGEATRDMTLARYLAENHHVDRKDLDTRGWMFEELGIEVNGEVVTTADGWATLQLHKGDSVIVHDIAVNHRYGGDVADTLVTMMVRKGAYTPVSITEGNPTIINDALAYHGHGGDYAIETFHKIASGDTMGKILAEQNVPRDLWMASVYAMRADGYVDPDHLQPGDLVQIYGEETLRANVEQIYATEEARLLGDRTDVAIHVVQPGEAMDEITSHYFERNRYSTAEWGRLRNALAGQVPGISLREVQMPGDEYTPPYTVTEYNYKADTVLEIPKADLAQLDEMITDQRLAERVYLPETMPIKTEAGIVEAEMPAEIAWLINDSIDRHPEYSEQERTAAALVFANEGMREVADKNAVSSAIAWVNEEGVRPAEAFTQDALAEFGLGEINNDSLSQTLDQIIEVSEYATSRQIAKDGAWLIHDTPAAAHALDQALFYARLDISFNRSTDVMHQVGLADSDIERFFNNEDTAFDEIQDKIADTLETIKGVTSAGLFQVRAPNFVEEGDTGRNTTEEVFGHRMSYDQLETELRANPMLNVDAATHILHENALVINTYLEAFGDPNQGDEASIVLAIANSYNGGPYKTMLGGLQVGIRDIGQDLGITDLALDKATGRDTTETQAAFVQICTRLAEEGKIQRTPDEILADSKLLGSNTIAFLQSETMQEFKQAYGQETGKVLTLLPQVDRLDDKDVSYGNYGYLSVAGGALDAIQTHTQVTRNELSPKAMQGMARDYVTHPLKYTNAG